MSSAAQGQTGTIRTSMPSRRTRTRESLSVIALSIGYPASSISTVLRQIVASVSISAQAARSIRPF